MLATEQMLQLLKTFREVSSVVSQLLVKSESTVVTLESKQQHLHNVESEETPQVWVLKLGLSRAPLLRHKLLQDTSGLQWD